MYRNILIATDGSELALKAVDHGAQLAKKVGASAIILTVTESWSGLDMAGDFEHGVMNPVEMYESTAAKSAEKILAVAAEKAKSHGIDCKTLHIRDSPPAEGILATATEKECDLIVMASHGRRGLNRMLMGSQTAEVIAYSKIPVLVLR